MSAVTPGSAGNNPGPATNDVVFVDNTFRFNNADEWETGRVRAIVDNIAWEGVECFTFEIDTTTCVGNDLGPTPETQICVIDRTRK